MGNVARLNDEAKVDFIKNRLLTGQPENFIAKTKTRPDHCKKLFYDDNNEIREWILVDNNIFYCLYCICFGQENNNTIIDELSKDGINYINTNTRLSQKLKRHEDTKTHIYSQKMYLKAFSKLSLDGLPKTDYSNEFRNAIRCAVKATIFLATHGQNYRLI